MPKNMKETNTPEPKRAAFGSALKPLLGRCKHCDSADIDTYNKFKDVLELNGSYYTVYLAVCLNCGEVYDGETWVERA